MYFGNVGLFLVGKGWGVGEENLKSDFYKSDMFMGALASSRFFSVEALLIAFCFF